MSDNTSPPLGKRVCEICGKAIAETVQRRPGRPRKYHAGECAAKAEKIQHIRWAHCVGVKIFKTERAKK